MENDTALKEEQIPLASRVWISLADAATAILAALVLSGAMTYYFTKIRGLSLELNAVVWLLFGIWNAVNDPLFGFISDRTKSKLGRRIPYIRYGAPIFVLGFALFWIDFPNTQNSQTALFIQMLLALFIFDTLYTAIATSIYIMPYEIAISNKARSSVYLWKIAFMVFTIVVPLVIEGTLKPGSREELAKIQTFQIALILIGIGMGALIFFSTWFYREKHFSQEGEQFAFFKSLVACFQNRSFIVFETISFTVIFAQTALMQGLWLFFDEIEVSREPLYAALAMGIILGVVLWVRQRDRWGLKTAMQTMSFLFAIGCASLLFFGQTLPGALAGFFLFGIGFAGGMYLVPLMNGDVVDYDEHCTGLRREGMYAGINSFITKPAISLAQAALSTIMAYYGYDTTLAKGLQSSTAETGIIVGWVAPTGVLLLLCVFLLRYYPLTGAAWETIKQQLAAIHRKKEEEFLRRQS